MKATLIARTTRDGLVSIKDHIEVGQEYIISGPPKMQTWKHIPTGREVPRVSVPCVTERHGVTEWLPLELLRVPESERQRLTSFLLDMIRR